MKKRVLTAGLVLFSVVLVLLTVILPIKSSSAAILPTFNQLFVFGDSLSDPGNFFNLTHGQYPSDPYVNGRFSNGYVWAEYIGKSLGLTPTLVTEPKKPGNGSEGINFAFGGAKTGHNSSITNEDFCIPLSFSELPVIPGIQDQVKCYLGLAQKPDPNALYAIWGGTNDYGANIDPEIVVHNLSDDVRSLVNAGAKNILVFNLPNLGRTPDAIKFDLSEQWTALSEEHNNRLEASVKDLRSTLKANIILVDIYSLFSEVEAYPAEFGFEHFIEPCVEFDNVGVEKVCENPDAFFFFDGIHPTTKVHKLIADKVYLQLNSKPASWN